MKKTPASLMSKTKKNQNPTKNTQKTTPASQDHRTPGMRLSCPEQDVHLLVGEPQGSSQLPDLLGAEVLLALEPVVQDLQLLLGEGRAALGLLHRTLTFLLDLLEGRMGRRALCGGASGRVGGVLDECPTTGGSWRDI